MILDYESVKDKPKIVSNYIINISFIFTTIYGLMLPFLADGVLGEGTKNLFHVLYVGFGVVVAWIQFPQLGGRIAILYFIIALASAVHILRGALGFTVSLFFSASFFICSGLALAVIRGAIAPNVAKLACYFILGYFFLMMLSGVNPNNMMPHNSRNAVSYYGVASTMILVVLYRNGQIKPPVIAAFLSLILSVWAEGRSGIISSFLILISMAFARGTKPKFLRFGHEGKAVYILTYIIKISILALIFTIYYMNIPDEYLLYFKTHGFESKGREYINTDYFHSITLESIFLGFELDSISSIADLNLNPHNSFIALHAYFGFFAIIIVLSLFLGVLKEILFGNMIFAICSIAYCLRIFTDSGIALPINAVVLLILFFYGGLQLKNARKNYPSHFRPSPQRNPYLYQAMLKPRSTPL